MIPICRRCGKEMEYTGQTEGICGLHKWHCASNHQNQYAYTRGRRAKPAYVIRFRWMENPPNYGSDNVECYSRSELEFELQKLLRARANINRIRDCNARRAISLKSVLEQIECNEGR